MSATLVAEQEDGAASAAPSASRPTFAQRYREEEAYTGACPIEAGVLLKLADHECPHDRLPHDPTPPCGCWPWAEGPAPAPTITNEEVRQMAIAVPKKKGRPSNEERRARVAARLLEELDVETTVTGPDRDGAFVATAADGREYSIARDGTLTEASSDEPCSDSGASDEGAEPEQADADESTSDSDRPPATPFATRLTSEARAELARVDDELAATIDDREKLSYELAQAERRCDELLAAKEQAYRVLEALKAA